MVHSRQAEYGLIPMAPIKIVLLDQMSNHVDCEQGAFGLTEVHHSSRQCEEVRGLDWSRADYFIQLGGRIAAFC